MSGQGGAEEEEDAAAGGGRGGGEKEKGGGSSEGLPQEQDISAEQAEEKGERFRRRGEWGRTHQDTAGYRRHPPADFQDSSRCQKPTGAQVLAADQDSTNTWLSCHWNAFEGRL